MSAGPRHRPSASANNRAASRDAATRLGPRPLEEREEAVRVDELRRDGQAVGAVDELEDSRSRASLSDLRMLAARTCSTRRLPIGVELRPELLYKSVDANRVAVIEEEHRKERTLLRRRRGEVDAVDLHAGGGARGARTSTPLAISVLTGRSRGAVSDS